MKRREISYEPEELAFLERHKELPRQQLHARFCFVFERQDITVQDLKALCTRRGWKTGRSGCFVPGQVPPNKGQKMPYHPNSARTRFQKGQAPRNYRGPGHESTDKDGYVWLIVAQRNPHTGAATHRVQKHIWLWEEANGLVPPGHVLKCVDSNRGNTDPSNWEAIPQAMLPRLGGRSKLKYDAAPAELKPTLMAIAKLKCTAQQLQKHEATHA